MLIAKVEHDGHKYLVKSVGGSLNMLDVIEDDTVKYLINIHTGVAILYDHSDSTINEQIAKVEFEEDDILVDVVKKLIINV